MSTATATPKIGSYYQRVIRELDAKRTVNPAGVEASMRVNYGTLNHLCDSHFRREIRLARECEAAEPGYLRRVAESFGMADDFDAWEAQS
jgi:hypothetical protein